MRLLQTKQSAVRYACLFFPLVLLTGVQAQEAPERAQTCAQCHGLKAPAETSLADRSGRMAPPLYYAGDKFRREWLVQWLQAPVRIRPAGDYPPAHTRTVDSEDEIDHSTLVEHPAYDAATATALADWLMTLGDAYDPLIAAEADYTPGTVNPRLGTLDFVKFKGCGACHRDTPEYGGFSGPELYTAWQRLQPAFIVSYIRNPGAWEPYSLMPDKELQDAQIHKLANYLKVIGEQEE